VAGQGENLRGGKTNRNKIGKKGKTCVRVGSGKKTGGKARPWLESSNAPRGECKRGGVCKERRKSGKKPTKEKRKQQRGGPKENAREGIGKMGVFEHRKTLSVQR